MLLTEESNGKGSKASPTAAATKGETDRSSATFLIQYHKFLKKLETRILFLKTIKN